MSARSRHLGGLHSVRPMPEGHFANCTCSFDSPRRSSISQNLNAYLELGADAQGDSIISFEDCIEASALHVMMLMPPGGGLIIFQGMQGAAAQSIKSLEGFRIAGVEEAQTLTQVNAQHRHARQPHQIARSNRRRHSTRRAVFEIPKWE
jgi:hypothetical protein